MESESKEALEKFIDRYIIAYARNIYGTHFWIIIRGMPKKRGEEEPIEPDSIKIDELCETDENLNFLKNNDVTDFVEDLSLTIAAPPERTDDEYL